MKFDPNKYETVKERKKRFYADHPEGAIVVDMVQSENIERYALHRASVYRTREDRIANIPAATGYAFELRDTEISVSSEGKKYESVNYSSWCENAEESAVGRALDNAGYAGNDKCSRDEMEKAQRMSKIKHVAETKQKGDIVKLRAAIIDAKTDEDMNKLRSMVSLRQWTDDELAEIDVLMNPPKFDEVPA
jgi:hypothetical protein